MDAHPELNKVAIRMAREQFLTEVNDIRADRRFSNATRRNAIASAHRRAQRRPDQAREQYLTDTTAYRTALEADLFGDAQFTGSEETATHEFEQARSTGDTNTMRAILRSAVEHQWARLILQADSIAPGTFNKVTEYESLTDIDYTQLLADTTIPKPVELGTADGDQIAAWADQHRPLNAANRRAYTL